MTQSRGIKAALASRPNLGPETVKDIFYYNPETGILYWKIHGMKTLPGDRAGSQQSNGRWAVSYKRNDYLVSRIVWLYCNGKWPDYEIDHIDLDHCNDRIENLRDITHSHNMANTKARSNNKTGVKGVHWDKQRSLYKVSIMKDYKAIDLGRFSSLEEAKNAYDLAARELFGEAARS